MSLNETEFCQSHFLSFDKNIRRNSKKIAAVLLITLIAMFFEIYYGYKTGSMALLADGWHMATHAAALSISYFTYKIAISPNIAKKFNFGGGKIIALGGFTSSLFLFFMVLFIALEAIQRLRRPVMIAYDEALFVAVIGLAINIICAYILRDQPHSHGHYHEDGGTSEAKHGHGHKHDHKHERDPNHEHKHKSSGGSGHDHNIRGAYLHVLADALTSIAAIAALLLGRYWNLFALDPIIGIIGALVICKWAVTLFKETGWELLDGHASHIDYQALRKRLSENAKIIDLHIWRVAPETLACELIVTSNSNQTSDDFRKILESEFGVRHCVIEVR